MSLKKKSLEVVYHTPDLAADVYPYRIEAAGHSIFPRNSQQVTRRFYQHVFILTISGCGIIEINGTTSDATPGTLTWLNTAGAYAHGCHPDFTHWEYMWFSVKGYELDRLFAQQRQMSRVIHEIMPQTQSLFERALATLKNNQPSIASASSAIAANVISIFLADEPDNVLKDRRAAITGIADAFRADIAGHWDITRFAALTGLSPSVFHKTFKELNGKTPMEWVRLERINAAKYFLCGTDERVAAIGQRCGYLDPYHFSREFHRITGLTPSEFRKTAGY